MRCEEWHKGYEAAKDRISAIGWEETRNEFNTTYPQGQKIVVDKLRYALGYFQAITDVAEVKL